MANLAPSKSFPSITESDPRLQCLTFLLQQVDMIKICIVIKVGNEVGELVQCRNWKWTTYVNVNKIQRIFCMITTVRIQLMWVFADDARFAVGRHSLCSGMDPSSIMATKHNRCAVFASVPQMSMPKVCHQRDMQIC
jgi:hypothetical protein